jgi:phosphoglycerate-specific signal transduction histidine kinase
MAIDDKLFSSEIKRLDSAVLNAGKTQEKFETRVESAVHDLRQDIARIDTKIDSNFRWMIGTYITLTSIILAAFYVFGIFRTIKLGAVSGE